MPGQNTQEAGTEKDAGDLTVAGKEEDLKTSSEEDDLFDPIDRYAVEASFGLVSSGETRDPFEGTRTPRKSPPPS